MEYEMSYTDKMILVNVLNTNREDRLADKIKNMLLTF